MGDQVARTAEYHRLGDTVAFTHTMVERGFEGRGLGSLLARGALDAVRAPRRHSRCRSARSSAATSSDTLPMRTRCLQTDRRSSGWAPTPPAGPHDRERRGLPSR
jgi:hypothetical protein